jgi:hypothetical protein
MEPALLLLAVPIVKDADHWDARDRALDLQFEADQAQVGYQHVIRRLHASGASLREVAEALGLSYQRVHQIVDVGSGKGAVKECQSDRVCSFCGASQKQVRTLVAGPGVFVCDRCVDLAKEVLTEAEDRSNGWTGLAVETESEAKCNFCGKRQCDVEGIVVAPDGIGGGKFARRRYARRFPGVRICSDCLALCSEIQAERT